MNIVKGNIASILLLRLFLLEIGVLVLGVDHGSNGGLSADVLHKEPSQSNFDTPKGLKEDTKQEEINGASFSSFTIDQKKQSQTLKEMKEEGRGTRAGGAEVADAAGGGGGKKKEGANNVPISNGDDNKHEAIFDDIFTAKGKEGGTVVRQAIFNDISSSNEHGQVPNNKKRPDSTLSFVKRHPTFVKNSKKENAQRKNQSMQTVGSRNLKIDSITKDNIFTHKSLPRESLNDEQNRVEDVTHTSASNRSVQNKDDGKTNEEKSNQVTKRKVSGRNRFSTFRSGSMQMPLTAVRFISNYNYDGTETLYCLKPRNLRPPSELRIRACDSITDQSNWFYFDSNQYLRLSIDSSKCIRWVKTRLFLDNCPIGDPGLQRAQFKFNTMLRGIEAQKGGSLKQWMICIDPTDKFDLVRLYLRNAGRDNKSCYAWTMDYASESPSLSPTSSPSLSPSSKPSLKPSSSPSVKPSSEPSLFPSSSPSVTPTAEPSMRPSASPTSAPSSSPSSEPSLLPSSEPSLLPSVEPSVEPSVLPSSEPSLLPSSEPSDEPSLSPSDQPSSAPSSMPSDIPSDVPSDIPSDVPSDIPSSEPSLLPSSSPSTSPSLEPSLLPSTNPSSQPSQVPSTVPSDSPSMIPSTEPSQAPTTCKDEVGWVVNTRSTSIFKGMSCEELGNNDHPDLAEDWCTAVASHPDHVYAGKSVTEACCACGGSEFKTRFPSSQPSSRPTTSETPTVISEIPSSEPSSQPSVCRDEPDWYFENAGVKLTCTHIADNPADYCARFGHIYTRDKNTYLACCECGGGVHLSVSPSSIPTDSPSSNPSASPSLSFKPTVAVSEFPSLSPTSSIEPSIFPSGQATSRGAGESCNYNIECWGDMECNDSEDGKICRSPNSQGQTSSSGRLLDIESVSVNREDEVVTRRSSSDEPVQFKPDEFRSYASMDLDYSGMVYVPSEPINKIHLHGNAWKVFPISENDEYHITPNTFFTFTMKSNEAETGNEAETVDEAETGNEAETVDEAETGNEAETVDEAGTGNEAGTGDEAEINVNARAVCVDFDAVLSNMRRCIYLDGDDVVYHEPFNPNTRSSNFQRAKIWNLALEGTAEQSTTFKKGITEAYNANDGIIDPRDKSMVNVATNSISQTKNEDDSWWEVDFFGGSKAIAQIFIHKALVDNYSLPNFRVILCDDDDQSCPTENNDNRCTNEECNSESLTNSVRIFKYTDNTDSVVAINLPESSSAHKVKVERTDSGFLALAEVIVIPTNDGSVTFTYDIPIGKMLSEGVSFGYPIWDGVDSLINTPDNSDFDEGGLLTLNRDKEVYLVTNIVVLGSSLSTVTATIQYINEDDGFEEDICSVGVASIENTFHFVFPPNCIGNRIRVHPLVDPLPSTPQGSGSVRKIEVFGRKEEIPVIVDKEADPPSFIFDTVYGRPKIKWIGMIQKISGGSNPNDPNEGLLGVSKEFSGFSFSESDHDNSDIGRFRQLVIDGTPSQSSGLSYGSFGAFAQDVGGEIIVSGDKLTATLHGNAWKAFELETPQPVRTEDTSTTIRLEFNFQLLDEAEGHAICVIGKKGLSEDPFFGQNVHCVLLAGTQFNEWSHVKKLNLARLSSQEEEEGEDNTRVGQSYNSFVAEADKAKQAIDGNMNTYTNTDSQTHGRNGETSTDFYVVLEAGYIVTEVKIYNRLDSFKSRFDTFKVYVSREGAPEEILCEKELGQEDVDESGLVQVTDIDACIKDNGKLSSIPVAGATSNLLRVGIELLGQTTVTREGEGEVQVPYPHMIGEFEVYGKPVVHTEESEESGSTLFEINVEELLPESFSHIHYIALIQDNDFDIYIGESSFSNIQFSQVSTDQSSGDSLTPQPYDIQHPDAGQHSDFGSYRFSEDENTSGRIPNPGESWTQDTPERTDTWIVSGDETEDPKDFCFYTEVTTYGYNANNPSHTNMNNFWKTLKNTIITPNRATFHNIDYPPSTCEDNVTPRTPRIHMGPAFTFSDDIKCGLTKVFDENDEYTRLLRRCEGHCKTDADCEDGLVCGLNVQVSFGQGQRNAERLPYDCEIGGWGPSPSSPGREIMNVCTKSKKLVEIYGTHDPEKVLDLCEGDCDTGNNDKCGENLKCIERTNDSDELPQGCAGDAYHTGSSDNSATDNGSYDYCGFADNKMPYFDICVDGVTLENPNKEFPKFMRENGFGSPFGETLGKDHAEIDCKDLTKVLVNNFSCRSTQNDQNSLQFDQNSVQNDSHSDHNYWSHETGYYTLHLISTLPSPSQFKTLIKRYIQQSISGLSESELETIADQIFERHVDYEQLYDSNLCDNTSTCDQSNLLTCEGNSVQEKITDEDYTCFEKEQEPQLTFSFHSEFPESHDKVFGTLPKLFKDQNSYGFSVTGELGQGSKNFPIYLQNHEEVSIPLAKDCYLVKIVFSDGDIASKQLPSIVGKGPLPEDCKKTNECVVHWCGEPVFSLQAESNDEISFSLAFHVTGEEESLGDFCLCKSPTAESTCIESESWSSEARSSIRSTLMTRKSIKLSNANDDSVLNHCFQFPFDYNFDDYLNRRENEENSAVERFHLEGFRPPANVKVQAFLKILDIAHDVGGALAIYRKEVYNTAPGMSTVATYEAQVCNPEMNSYDSMNMTVFRDEENEVSIATVSDSGTFVAAKVGSQLLLYKLDMVTNVFSAISAPENVDVDEIQSIALTPHGHFIALLITGGNVQLLQKHTLHNTYDEYDLEWDALNSEYEYDEISIHASESGVISLQVRDSSDTDNVSTKEIHFVCSDTNSRFAEGGCMCRDGYVLKNEHNVLKKYVGAGDICVPEIHSSMITVTKDSATFPLSCAATLNYCSGEECSETDKVFVVDGDNFVTKGIKLEKRDKNGNFQIIPAEDDERFTMVTFYGEGDPEDCVSKFNSTLTNLQPGTLYKLTVQYYGGSMNVRFVTSCTNNNGDSLEDRTGMPRDFRILDQQEGKIMVEFSDNSLCENVFTLVRYSEYEEFSQSIGNAVTIASFKAGSESSGEGSIISPGESLHDDLKLSKLTVGHTYIYCIHAGTDLGTYMPSPYDTSIDSADLNHSEQNCMPHNIRWEASIAGLVTTEPHAGSLPIKDVIIEYELLSQDLEELSCGNECSGSITTSVGGGYEVSFNVVHPYLEGVSHLDEIPVRLKFSKTTQGHIEIPHTFYCEDGESCSEHGYIVYLKHLEFNKRVQVFDATHVMFTGRVYVYNTVFAGSSGCPIVNAKVDIFHLKEQDNESEEPLSTTTTDGDGRFEAPVVIGSIVNEVKITYHGHNFTSSLHNNYNYDDGVVIYADGFYNGNDFVDESKATMKLEVAGGECDYPLGTSTALIKILGCDWQGMEIEHDNNEFSMQIGNLPAAILQVEIRKVKDQDGNRIDVLSDAFSGEIRSIDLRETAEREEFLAEEEANEVDTETGRGQDQVESVLEEGEELAEEEEAVRFQYNGELTMNVQVEHLSHMVVEDVQYDQLPYDVEYDSFHIIDFMTIFSLKVDLMYNIPTAAGVQMCNIVSNDHNITIRSGLGVDRMQGFDTFYKALPTNTKKALAYCSSIDGLNPDDKVYPGEGECLKQVEYDNEDSRSGVSTTLATGRPNPFGSFTRNLFITVQAPELSQDVSHTATFFIQGNYGKGGGNSFALPTHEAITVLRDPPGGSSYMSYENVVTKSRVVSSSLKVNAKSDLEVTISGGSDIEGQLCSGGGAGAIVLYCSEVAESDVDAKFPFEAGIQADLHNQENEARNEVSVTWSYTTDSEDPARSGRESDVFVVPNLSVRFEEVFLVEWDYGNKKPVLVPNPFTVRGEVLEPPTSVIFDLASEKNKPALSFFSRYHLTLVTIPELKNAIKSQGDLLERMHSEIICCQGDKLGSCLGQFNLTHPGRICAQEDFDVEQAKYDTLDTALEGWQHTLLQEDVARETAIQRRDKIDGWFQHVGGVGNVNFESEGGNFFEESKDQIKIEDMAVQVAPEELISRAHALESASALFSAAKDNQEGFDEEDSDEHRDVLRNAMRIQVTGDAGVYEMTLTRDATKTFTRQNCDRALPAMVAAQIGTRAGPIAAAVMGSASVALPVATGVVALTFAAGGCNYELDLGGGSGNMKSDHSIGSVSFGLEGGMKFNFHIEHESTYSEEEELETSITFALGDPDDGDEFTIDIFHDPAYGSFVFDVAAGRSRCRHEEGTIRNEEARITLEERASQFIFPDEQMFFDVEFQNVGEHAYSYFLIAQDIDNTTSSLEMRLDSFISLDYEGTLIKLYKEDPVIRAIRILRDPTGYEFRPVKLALRSACEFAMDYETQPVTELLYNYNDNGDLKLKWLEPCPVVMWAGELKKENSFLINLNSDNRDVLPVTVFNPKHNEKNSTFFHKLKENGGRLDKIEFKYREQGSFQWMNGMTSEIVDMNFAQAPENEYGFVRQDWYVGDGAVKDGTYEIMIQSTCTNVGGPPEFQYHRDSILVGAIDFTEPEQYGYPLPLNDEVMLGEEMTVRFTEDLDCSFPYKFDLEMTITGPSQSPSESQSPSKSPIPESDENGEGDLNNAENNPNSGPEQPEEPESDPDEEGDPNPEENGSQNKDLVLEKGGGLHVICEGREIKFQVDYTFNTPVSLINGQEFTVELGAIDKVGLESQSYIADKNGNKVDPLKPNIRFTKRFASINLSESSTEFRLLRKSNDMDCTDASRENHQRLLRSELMTLTDSGGEDRFEISSVFCDKKRSSLSAKVKILPSTKGRRFLKGSDIDVATANDLYNSLHYALKSNSKRRKLSDGTVFSVHDVRIIPSLEDMEMYSKANPDMVEDIQPKNPKDDAIVDIERMENDLKEEMEKEKNVEINELKKELEKRDMEMKTEMQLLRKQNMEMIRRLGESSNVNNDGGRMFFIQLFIILGCLSVFGAAILFASHR